MKYLHINLTVGYSEGGGWSSGQGQASVQFELPKEMYAGSNFLKLVDEAIKEAEGKYPEAKKEAEERQARWDKEREEKRLKEQAEKAEQEAPA